MSKSKASETSVDTRRDGVSVETEFLPPTVAAGGLLLLSAASRAVPNPKMFVCCSLAIASVIRTAERVARSSMHGKRMQLSVASVASLLLSFVAGLIGDKSHPSILLRSLSTLLLLRSSRSRTNLAFGSVLMVSMVSAQPSVQSLVFALVSGCLFASVRPVLPMFALGLYCLHIGTRFDTYSCILLVLSLPVAYAVVRGAEGVGSRFWCIPAAPLLLDLGGTLLDVVRVPQSGNQIPALFGCLACLYLCGKYPISELIAGLRRERGKLSPRLQSLFTPSFLPSTGNKAVYGLRAIFMAYLSLFHAPDPFTNSTRIYKGVKACGCVSLYAFLVMSSYFYFSRVLRSAVRGDSVRFSAKTYFTDIWNRTVQLSPVVIIAALLRSYSPYLASFEPTPTHTFQKISLTCVLPFAELLLLPAQRTLYWPNLGRTWPAVMGRPTYVFWWIGLELQLIWVWLPLLRVAFSLLWYSVRAIGLVSARNRAALACLCLAVPSIALYGFSTRLSSDLAYETLTVGRGGTGTFWGSFYFRPVVHLFAVPVGVAVLVFDVLLQKHKDRFKRLDVLVIALFAGMTLLMQRGPMWMDVRTTYREWGFTTQIFTWCAAAVFYLTCCTSSTPIITRVLEHKSLVFLGFVSWAFMVGQVGFTRTTVWGTDARAGWETPRIMPCFNFSMPFTLGNLVAWIVLLVFQCVMLAVPLHLVQHCFASLLRLNKH